MVGRAEFPAFPYEPYSVQRDFMQHLYSLLETGGVGLFESPTGTGKTLSLICSTLQWLEDRNKVETQEKQSVSTCEGQDADTELPDWMRDHTAQQQHEQQAQREAQRAERLQKAKLKLSKSRGVFGTLQSSSGAPIKGAKGLSKSGARPPGSLEDQDGITKEDSEFLLDEWDSEGEDCGSKRKAIKPRDDSSDEDRTDDEDEQDVPKRRQVYFCSRTHSQLSQFVSELHRTPFAASFSVAAVASRKALCINDSVQRLGNATRINEKCLDLQSGKGRKKVVMGEQQGSKNPSSKSQSGCPFRKSNMKSQRQLTETVLAMPMDVEDLARLGRRKEVCPYYAARAALAEADLVLLPYPALLLQETRESLGVRLEGNVVVVDEAHNLVDAVNNVHSALVSAQQLATAQSALDNYFQRFRSVLAPGNSKHIQTLICLASTLQRCWDKPTACAGPSVQTVNDFLFSMELDNMNFFRLIRYVKESKVLVKIAGYADALNAKAADQVTPNGTSSDASIDGGSGMSALHALVGLASALNNADADGRIIVDAAAKTLKFVLLNAGAHFVKVLASAHAVVLASGTLAPVASLKQQLFPGLPVAQMHEFTCGHVVPKERLLAVALGRGPTGATLDLRHEQRAQPSSMDEVGRLLTNICQAVPQGVVAFFPSFAYADAVYAHWQSSGALAALNSRKHVFREPRSSVDVENVLRQYGEAANGTAGTSNADGQGGKCPTGALLLCVVGGKMSEGINFADGMGRCVVMVGMPFPNPTNAELCERMRFMDTSAAQSLAACTPQGDGMTHASASSPGREYFEDLCMKAVNQCIGRVIRHRGDWAAVVLADVRWTAGGAHAPLHKLPGWIQESLVVASGFGDAYSRLSRFVRSM
ncbi:ATP-dependent DNA helicase DDX11 [Coccomyxa sp. Obi]|nr:ATP-dependent DNA helicase DDX11 [Coccomyxa sp. Obi]